MTNRAAMALLVALLLLYSLPFVRGQATDPDTIDFTTMPSWKDLRYCLQCQFNSQSGCWYPMITGESGCGTNACICRADIMGKMIPEVSSAAQKACSDLDDASMAVSLYTAYCSTKGYTQIVKPTILQTTGAFTVTVTATTGAATVTATVHTSEAGLTVVTPPLATAATAMMVTMAVVGTPFLWMLYRQRLSPLA